MSFATVRRYSFCILLLLYIISGIRTVSAEMKGIPRSEEDKICAVFLPSTAQKPLSLNSDILLDKINAHRASLGLPAYQKEEKLCALAKERGPELYNEIFTNGNIHGGLYNRNLPYWITENMKYGPNEDDVFNWWMNSTIHKKAIEGDFLYSCGECYGNSCAQLFTSYVSK